MSFGKQVANAKEYCKIGDNISTSLKLLKRIYLSWQYPLLSHFFVTKNGKIQVLKYQFPSKSQQYCGPDGPTASIFYGI